jgi:hypothetical protein
MSPMRRSLTDLQLYNVGSTDQEDLEYLHKAVPPCLNTSMRNEEVLIYLTSPKLQNLKGRRGTLKNPREREDPHFSFPPRRTQILEAMEFDNLIILQLEIVQLI